jgi:hypothetical protein
MTATTTPAQKAARPVDSLGSGGPSRFGTKNGRAGE